MCLKIPLIRVSNNSVSHTPQSCISYQIFEISSIGAHINIPKARFITWIKVFAIAWNSSILFHYTNKRSKRLMIHNKICSFSNPSMSY